MPKSQPRSQGLSLPAGGRGERDPGNDQNHCDSGSKGPGDEVYVFGAGATKMAAERVNIWQYASQRMGFSSGKPHI